MAPAPRELPLEDLFVPPSENITVMHRVTPGEVLSEVMVPVRPGTRSTFIKYAMRNSWDFALASVGAALRVESGRRARRPHRPRRRRARSRGEAWRQSGQSRAGRSMATTIESAAQAAIAEAHPLAQNEYKVALVETLVRSALTELGQ